MDELDNHSGRGEPLPLDTVAATELLDMFRDPDHDVDRIVEFISQDPVLATETLRRCNNVRFGGGERVTDIFEAVNRLGYYELYGIIAASIGARSGKAKDALSPGKVKGPVRVDSGPSLD
ncbi:MAG: HDOD domain-containing protein [Verrucomicrobiae bacterium]|nr:HDOD domain-containing protein [Verrucomicrobiae bacterium]